MFSPSRQLAILACPLMLSAPAYAQLTQEVAADDDVNSRSIHKILETKLVAERVDQYDQFGSSVAISGDYLVSGAPYTGHGVSVSVGTAYVYRRDGSTWVEQALLAAPDGNSSDYFGNSVSTDGAYAVVGANGDEVNGFNSGAAFIFRREGNNWVLDTSLIPKDGDDGDNFGFSASLSGDYCVVGAYGDDDDGGLARGSAYMYIREGTTWTLQEKLVPNDEGGYFGYSVSLSGDDCLIGARAADDRGSSSGAAYVFRRDGTSWTQEAKLLACDGSFNDFFGSSVSISGDDAIVGAPQIIDGPGFASFFKRRGTEWIETQRIVATDGADGDYFGNSVSISGDRCIIGAPIAGSAYVYRREGSLWTLGTNLMPSDGAPNNFGRSVSIYGDYALVGENLDNENGTLAGAVYVYSECSPQSVASVDLALSPHSKTDLAKERVSQTDAEPGTFQLLQNNPNPFNPSTTISYVLNQDSHVSLAIYNIAGRLVVTLVAEAQAAGYKSVSWNGKDDSGVGVASGVYLYRLTVDGLVASKRMLFLK